MSTPSLPIRRVLAPCSLLALLGVAAIVQGCSSSGRERYFASRSATVPAAAGDGTTRAVLWPSPNARAAWTSLDAAPTRVTAASVIDGR
jgi:hypothetical protein